MHFYHQDNVLCNPRDCFQTNSELTHPTILPLQVDPGVASTRGLDANDCTNNWETFPCWSDDDDEDVINASTIAGDNVITEMPLFVPDVDSVQHTLGIAFTNAHAIETQLAKMLNDIQAPKSMYTSILKWGRDAYNQGYNFVPRHGTKASLIASLQKQFHLHHFRPNQIEIELPGDKLRVQITCFDFTKGLHSLLTHPELTANMDNLDVNPMDPFGKYVAPNGRLGAVHLGQWYENAYHTCIKDPTTDFLVPICFACDEAKLSGGTTGCWPLMFSTTIFNQTLRNQSIAWRPLGYIYDLSIDETSSIHTSQTTHL